MMYCSHTLIERDTTKNIIVYKVAIPYQDLNGKLLSAEKMTYKKMLENKKISYMIFRLQNEDENGRKKFTCKMMMVQNKVDSNIRGLLINLIYDDSIDLIKYSFAAKNFFVVLKTIERKHASPFFSLPNLKMWKKKDYRSAYTNDTTATTTFSSRSYTLLKDPGYKIVLSFFKKKWKAVVYDNRYAGLTRFFEAEVSLEKGFMVEDFVTKATSWQSRRIHLVSNNKGNHTVYIGSYGLKGGGNSGSTEKRCSRWIPWCTDRAFRCVCGFRCKDNSCWVHCTKHYQPHRCQSCRRVNRCPRSKDNQCNKCYDDLRCFECCGCSEKQRQEEIKLKEREKREAARKLEEEAETHRQELLREKWARERERARKEEEERLRNEQARERERIRKEKAERKEKLLKKKAEEEFLRKQKEEERASIISDLDSALASTLLVTENLFDLNYSRPIASVDNSTEVDTDFTGNNSFSYEICEEPFLSRCMSNDSIPSLYDDLSDSVYEDSNSSLELLDFSLPQNKIPSRCSSVSSILSFSEVVGSKDDYDDKASLLDFSQPDGKVPSRRSSVSSIFNSDDDTDNKEHTHEESLDFLALTSSRMKKLSHCSSVSSISSLDTTTDKRDDNIDDAKLLGSNHFSPVASPGGNTEDTSLFTNHDVVSDHYDSSDEDTTSYRDSSENLEHQTESTNIDSSSNSIPDLNNKNLPLIRLFIENYIADLSLEEKTFFQESTGKIIEQKLLQVSKMIQEEIIDYFTNEGMLYPCIIEHYSPTEWILQSLIKELICYSQDCHYSLNIFRKQWLNISESYSIPDQIFLLKSLRIKKIDDNLSLKDISSILEIIFDTGKSGYSIVCSESENWKTSLRCFWLESRVSILTNFSLADQNTLSSFLTNMSWGLPMVNYFFNFVKEETAFEPVMELLNAVKTYNVPDTLVCSVLNDCYYPVDSLKSRAKQWTHTITYQSLLHIINSLSPELANSIKTSIYNLLKSSCSAKLLEKFIRDNLELLHEHRSKFSEVLDLLYDYTITEELCSLAFTLLLETSSNDWLDRVDKAISSKIFNYFPVEYSVNELIEQIVSSSSAFSAVRLKHLYDSVIESYNAPSAVLQSASTSSDNLKKKSISSWDMNSVSLWAKQIKSSRSQIHQFELIAGVMQAVKLYHGVYPRDAQLLALLVLLNPTDGMGSLAQINTGEGKSLIVAMLAAIHGLRGKKVDVVTTSTELSKPEVKNQTKFFNGLSLTVAENSNIDTKESVYKCDIVYGIAGEFQADILRTEFLSKDIRKNRGFGVVIVDEVDSMLFDNRSHSVRLSDQSPGMVHLELPMGAIWEHMQRVTKMMTTIDDQAYFIPEPFKRIGTTIKLDSGVPWRSCAEVVTNKQAFITEKVQTHLENLLRDLDKEEKQEYKDFKLLNSKIIALEKEIANTTDAQKKSSKEALCKNESENLKALPWNKRYPVLDVPIYLRNFARLQIPYWIKSALHAAYYYKRDAHYTVNDDDAIVPVHYKETGVLQPNMVWSDGVTQFLQLKEGLPIDPEGISTNFISNVGFFQRYESSIYGLTGTLGEKSTKDFLHKIYNADTIIIPPYQHRKIFNNSHTSYLCKELAPIIVSNEKEWSKKVIDCALSHARHHRSTLIICKYIGLAEDFSKALRKKYDEKKVLLYTGKSTSLPKRTINSGDIVVATNIAGRGTDLKTSDSVESHGGMYVCVTFLPESYRVEMQNVGRTARSGKKGMAQLILHNDVSCSIEEIKKNRYLAEVAATDKAIEDALKMLAQDKLFYHFCCLENKLLPTASSCELVKKWKDLVIAWNECKAKELSGSKIEEGIKKRKEELIKALSQEKLSKLTPSDREAYREKAFRQAESERSVIEEKHKKVVLENFCNFQTHLPQELITCLKEGSEFLTQRSELAERYEWGTYERKGFEEDWGFWLKGERLEEKNLSTEEILKRFSDTFKTSSEDKAEKDCLIRNPYFYVLKGNEYLSHSNVKKAIDCYDRSCKMEPDFSVNALYNKAQALLSYKKNKGEYQEKAYEALKQAKAIINTVARPSLLTFSTLVAQHSPKVKTSKHVQSQLDLLSQQESYIDKALSVLDEAKNKNHVEVETQFLSEAFQKSDVDHSKVIREASVNGFTRLFTVKKVIPIPWASVVALAFISLAQIAGGCLLVIYSGGNLGRNLISEGISDMYTAIKSAVQGTFDWGAWALQKAISLAVSVVSFGIDALKNGFQSACKDTFGTVGQWGVKDGIKHATRDVTVALGKGALNEVATSAAQWIADKAFMEDLDQYIKTKTEQQIMESILNNPLVVKGLELDIKNRDNCWQNLFIQEGLSLLMEEHELKKKGMELCKKFATEVGLASLENAYVNHAESKGKPGSDNIGGRIVVKLGTAFIRSTKAFDSVFNYTNDFMNKFNKKVQSHSKDLESAKQKVDSSNLTSTATASSSTNQEILSSNLSHDQLDDSTIDIDVAEEGTTYTFNNESEANVVQKSYIPEGPSTSKNIVNAFKEQITSTITGSIRENALNPVLKVATSELTSAIFRQVDQTTANLRKESIVRQTKKITEEANIANNKLSAPESNTKEKNTTEGQEVSNENIKKPPKLTKSEKKILKEVEKRISNGEPLDETDLASAAGALKIFIQVFNEKKEFMREYGDKSSLNVRMKYSLVNGQGHYDTLDSNNTVFPSGTNNCAVDVIVSQLSQDMKDQHKIDDGNDIRKVIVQHNNDHPEIAIEAYKCRNKLMKIAPEVIRSGGLTEWLNINYLKALKEGNSKEMARLEALHKSIDIAITKIVFITGVSVAASMTTAGVIGAYVASAAASALLDSDLREAIKAGDFKAAATHMVNHIPIIGSCKNATEAWENKNYKTACLFGVLAIVESVGVVKNGMTIFGKNSSKQGQNLLQQGKKIEVEKPKSSLAVVEDNSTVKSGVEVLGKKNIPQGESVKNTVKVKGGRAPEYEKATVYEKDFLDRAEKWLGPGYKDMGKGRFVSKDGKRQLRWGDHETKKTKIHHAHEEKYDKPGGEVIENGRITIVPDK